MSIVSLESADEKNVSASILNFLTVYGVISLLSICLSCLTMLPMILLFGPMKGIGKPEKMIWQRAGRHQKHRTGCPVLRKY